MSDRLGRGAPGGGATHNQALRALLCLSQDVRRQEVGSVEAVRARQPNRLPTVLPTAAALRGRHALGGVPHVRATRLSGSGVRGRAWVRVRGNEGDCAQPILLVRDGKGEKERLTRVPETLVAP